MSWVDLFELVREDIAESGVNLEVGGNVRLNNANYVSGKSSDGSTYMNILGINGSDNTLVGYGPYSLETGGTYVYGNSTVDVNSNATVRLNADTNIGLNAASGAIYAQTKNGGVYLNNKLGYFAQMGSVTITPSAANTPTAATVTFPYAFKSTPRICTNPSTTVPGTTVKGTAAYSVSTTGATIYLTRSNTTSNTVYWIAVGAL